MRALPPHPLTRFAPAPTGHLHLGHVVNAIFVWGMARARGGKVLLRIEDHDRQRCRPEFESTLLEDLEWLGLEPDLGVPGEYRAGPCEFRQSDRDGIYSAELERLAARYRVYACGCSRKDITAQAGDAFGEETRYPGTCRDLGLAFDSARAVRVMMENGEERFEDAALGWQAQEPASQCGDPLLRDRLGNWTYQFAVTVDDWLQGIDLVIRGEDLLTSTGRQIRLARMLGREDLPVFLHHPLIRRPDGAKLSKASRDSGIRDLRAAGISAGLVLGRAAYLAGLVKSPGSLAVDDLPGLFAS